MCLQHNMHLQKEDGATAAAEQLVAEEAQEAAKAAAKKAKKQKAKARKQQARSDPTPALAASPPASMLTQHDVEPTTTVHQSSPSPPSVSESPAVANLHTEQSTASFAALHQVADELLVEEQGDQSLPGTDTALQQHALHDEDQMSRPAAAAEGVFSGKGQRAIGAPRAADATFLDRLFCCPITKVAPTLTCCAMAVPRLFSFLPAKCTSGSSVQMLGRLWRCKSVQMPDICTCLQTACTEG